MTTATAHNINHSNTTSIPKAKKGIVFPCLSLTLDSPESECRTEIEAAVAQEFRQVHHAEIQHFLPYFLSTYNQKSITSSLGFRFAIDKDPLFLEHYLSQPIEQVLTSL